MHSTAQQEKHARALHTHTPLVATMNARSIHTAPPPTGFRWVRIITIAFAIYIYEYKD